MDKLKWCFREILLPACLLFTLLCFLFAVLFQVGSGGTNPVFIDLSNLGQILLFSLILSASKLLFSLPKLPFAGALVLHFVVFLLDIVVVFFLIGGHAESSRSAFIITGVFALIYLLIAAVILVIRSARLKKTNEPKPYKRQF